VSRSRRAALGALLLAVAGSFLIASGGEAAGTGSVNTRATRGGLPAPSVSISLALGVPGSQVHVEGQGFSPDDPLEIFFDAADLDTDRASSDGSLSTRIPIPVRAVPGLHWFSVVDRTTGDRVQTSFRVSTPWQQPGGDPTLSGFNRFEDALDASSLEGMDIAWKGWSYSRLTGAPAVDALGFSYVGTGAGRLKAYSRGCGAALCAPKWSVPLSSAVAGSPSAVGGFLYAASTDGTVSASRDCGSSTCAPVWTGSVGEPIAGSVAVTGRVYVGTTAGSVAAFPLSGCGQRTCPPLWTSSLGGSIGATPAVGGGRVFVGSTDGYATALLPGTGQRWWRRNVGSPVVSSPVFFQQPAEDPMVLVPTQAGDLWAFNAMSGTAIWVQRGIADVVSPAVAYGLVFAPGTDGVLRAIPTARCFFATCAPQWTATVGDPITSQPVIANGLVFVTAGQRILSFNARSGQLVWRSDVLGPDLSLAESDGSIYASSSDGYLRVLRTPLLPKPPPRPDPSTFSSPATPIRHVVVLFQENQSFDSVLGPLCVEDDRCDGAVTGFLPDGSPIPLARGRDIIPPAGHDARSIVAAVNGGSMNGFANIKYCGESYSYACYQAYWPDQIPNLAALARTFAISDRTFESRVGPSWGSHVVLAAADMDGFDPSENPFPTKGMPLARDTWGCNSYDSAPWRDATGQTTYVPACVPKPDGSGPWAASPVPWIPTIMDRLDEAGFTWRIYSDYNYWSVCPNFADCVFDPRRNADLPYKTVVADAAAGRLSNLTLVLPGWNESQHNQASMTAGDNWIGSVVSAIESSRQWQSTAIFITYDDCGCFYDHVPPPSGLSIRVPAVIISPFARAGFTDSDVASYESMLTYVEHTFGVPPLAAADASAYDYAHSFDYRQAPLSPVRLGTRPVPRRSREWLRDHPPGHDVT
jgi:phospholipase C